MQMHVAHSRVVVAMLSLAVGACGAGETDSERKLDARLRLSEEATAADVGLPTYPGSRFYEDADGSSPAANLGLSTPLFGFKVVAVKLETRDQPERVAAFYRQALSKYGTVLECSDRDNGNKSRSKAAHADELVCDPDDSGTHSVVYKVGTQENQRIVAIQPHGSGTRFDLVHFDIRGKSKQ
jgi:hypothetical protein